MSFMSSVANPEAQIKLKCDDCQKYRKNMLICWVCSEDSSYGRFHIRRYQVCTRCRKAHETMDELKDIGKGRET